MATIKDVSRRAGVSIATVSRAFSNPDKLTKETLEKVREAIDALDYRPNSIAQSLRSASSRSIIVMVPDVANPFFSRVLAGVETEASSASLSLLVANTRDDIAAEKECLGFLMAKRADGIIQLGARTAEELTDGKTPERLPFVHAIEATPETGVPTVAIDNVLAARSIAEAVLDRGHRRVAVLAGPEGSAITRYRLSGILEAMAGKGLDLPPERIVYSRFNLSAGAAAAEALLRGRPDFTALICMSDDLAIGAMRSARAAGLDLPGDLSVVGFDDISYSAFTAPPLATIAQPAEEIGQVAMRLLTDLIAGRRLAERNKVLDVAVRLRDSLGAPRGA